MTKNKSVASKKRPRGRPVLPIGAGKDTILSIRLSPTEKALYEKEAEKAGIGLSAWIRTALKKDI
jgi:hypothetical protein